MRAARARTSAAAALLPRAATAARRAVEAATATQPAGGVLAPKPPAGTQVLVDATRRIGVLATRDGVRSLRREGLAMDVSRKAALYACACILRRVALSTPLRIALVQMAATAIIPGLTTPIAAVIVEALCAERPPSQPVSTRARRRCLQQQLRELR